MKNKVLSLLFIATSFSSSAEEFVASYEGFYDRLKVVQKGDYEYARVNFYLVEGESKRPCEIASGKIVTEQTTLPLQYTADAQLMLPVNEKLDKDKAVVVVTPASASYCEIKIQIESAHFTNAELTKKKLYQLHNEFESLLSDLSGVFIGKLLSFMLPEQKGVTLEFTGKVSMSEPHVHCDNNRCRFEVPTSWQDDNGKFNVMSEVVSAKPWIVK
ncbi:DUF2987 domain-containing protein [Pseudoalteromonas luteoviolacea]|uniref:DUF2987 domain-containing protein n=1 Tax=Pseudoalteromonas luteoviolacea DSM 6061 TaxID=1365250 RepID=A0A161ZSF5_9GAMM|nr:DUF2987 domain-containing protein [Pseudoalteromonas luteoviolacea]KZN30766.1 hypothetical protein N475_05010 [Pseudoalteromonas luteoviolacea DSM 6061]KZN51715.1 hypothetical protein N474_23885 [Pseudoalteromonas luteoviolacea CPMOR-2]MBE0386431.1 hypothetical protein [Pseudoalteromonas luteoviolacea DSM 6061]TQF71278.1 DUF2987 domain-containing protein [Pseudoalteromonas luteoviolacea]